MDEGLLVRKVWGEEWYITNRDEYAGKILYVKPGFVCSSHCHRLKDETFACLSGRGVIEKNGEFINVQAGTIVPIPPGTWHRFASDIGMTLVEVSTRHSDDDVERKEESNQLDKEKHAAIWEALGLP